MPSLADGKFGFKQGNRHMDMYKYCMDNLRTPEDEYKVKNFLVMNTDIQVSEIIYQVNRVMLKKGLIEDIGSI